MMGYYDYEELKKAALEQRTVEALNALGEWFEQHGSRYWNGRCYTVDSTHDLYPVYKESGDGDYELIGWELN